MESFIARRLYKNEQGSRRVSRPAVLIAQAGVALGLAVMLLTIAVPKLLYLGYPDGKYHNVHGDS